jgi:hypothetical protein
VYEIYKAGQDPYWVEGLDLLSQIGLTLAVVPHYDDSSGGENYDSRFCYMGAKRFDALQACLSSEVSILGIDAYTAICFDPATRSASVSGQGGVTLIGEGGSHRIDSGSSVPFEAFRSSSREVVTTFDAARTLSGYEFTDAAEDGNGGPAGALAQRIEQAQGLTGNEKIDLLALLHSMQEQSPEGADDGGESRLVDLVLELRAALRAAKRFDLADKARDVLAESGFEIQDTPEGARWTRR